MDNKDKKKNLNYSSHTITIEKARDYMVDKRIDVKTFGKREGGYMYYGLYECLQKAYLLKILKHLPRVS